MILKSSLFPFYINVQTSKTVFCWIIVKDDKNSISSHHYSNEPIFFFHKKYCKNVYINQYAVNEMYSHICLHVFPVLWHFKKKLYTTIGTLYFHFAAN